MEDNNGNAMGFVFALYTFFIGFKAVILPRRTYRQLKKAFPKSEVVFFGAYMFGVGLMSLLILLIISILDLEVVDDLLYSGWFDAIMYFSIAIAAIGSLIFMCDTQTSTHNMDE